MTEPITQTELNEIMDRDPLELSAQDIDHIVAFQRQSRVNYESGVKPKKETGPKMKLDLNALGLGGIEPSANLVKRRI